MVTLIITSDNSTSANLLKTEAQENKVDGKEVMFIDINEYAKANGGRYPEKTPAAIQVIEGTHTRSAGYNLLPEKGAISYA